MIFKVTYLQFFINFEFNSYQDSHFFLIKLIKSLQLIKHSYLMSFLNFYLFFSLIIITQFLVIKYKQHKLNKILNMEIIANLNHQNN